jgi:hypothetical protein
LLLGKYLLVESLASCATEAPQKENEINIMLNSFLIEV